MLNKKFFFLNIKKSISSQLAVSIYTNQVSIFPPFRIKQEYTEESINTVECPLKPAVLSPSPHNIWPTSFYAKRKPHPKPVSPTRHNHKK